MLLRDSGESAGALVGCRPGGELRFLFGDHVLDTARRELRRGGEQIAVEP